MDLVEQIAHQQVELLNSNSDAAHVLRTGYREDGALTVASECDAQMFFHIPFTTRARSEANSLCSTFASAAHYVCFRCSLAYSPFAVRCSPG